VPYVNPPPWMYTNAPEGVLVGELGM
jgi:hypothetical protein